MCCSFTVARARLGLGVLLASAAAVLCAQGGSGANTSSGFGPLPLDCAAAHKDYTDPSCTVQSRNGTFRFDRHVVDNGGTLTGTVTNRCMKHSTADFSQPADQACPIDWTYVRAIGKKVSGCTPEASSCTVRIAENSAKANYTIVQVGISSDQGTGVARDYYAISGSTAPPVEACPTDSVLLATVIAVDGNAYVRHADGSKERAKPGVNLRRGDTVTTTGNGLFAIEFAVGGKIAANPNSEIKVTGPRSAVDESGQPIKIADGTLWQHFPDAPRPLDDLNGRPLHECVLGFRG